MKKILLIITLLLNQISYAQNEVLEMIQNTIYGNFDIMNQNNFKKIIELDSNSLSKGLNYISNYANDSLLYTHITTIKQFLSIITFCDNDTIRNKAIILLFDMYRLSNYTDYRVKLYWKDYDCLKKCILPLIKKNDYSINEIDILCRINRVKSKQMFTDNYYALFYNKEMTTQEQDSLLNKCDEQYRQSLSVCNQSKDFLYGICSWLYIKEAIPYIKNEVQTNELCNEKLKCYLARLGNSDYENELIEANYQSKVFDYNELAFINTKKSLKAMIDGLRISGQDYGVIDGFDKKGRYKAIEVVGDYYKSINLKFLLSGNYFKEKLPFSYVPNDLSLCEEVAKWMEDNIDKLEVNPNLRF